MKAKDVIGKRIASIEHVRWHDKTAGRRVDCTALVLDDGTRIVPHAFETEECPSATLLTVKPTQKKPIKTALT